MMKYIVFLTILFAVALVPLLGNAIPEPVPPGFSFQKQQG